MAEPVTVKTVLYHTVNHTAEHFEGEEYSVDDRTLLETLLALGYVVYVPSAPPPP